MKLTTVVVGPIQTNCYLIEDAGELIVVDPGAQPDKILAAIGERPVKEIVLTHYHWDHVSALSALEAALGAPAAASRVDAERIDGCTESFGHDITCGIAAPTIARRLSEGDEVKVGKASFKVIETPGHTAGSICLYCEEASVLVAGDTLFAGGRYGRTDFEDGSFDDIVRSMEEKLSGLPDDTLVLSGHEQSSLMSTERALNPYLH